MGGAVTGASDTGAGLIVGAAAGAPVRTVACSLGAGVLRTTVLVLGLDVVVVSSSV